MAAGSLMLDGGVAALEGRTDAAIAIYRRTIAAMDARDLMLFSNAVRARLGSLIGGDEGTAMRMTAIAWLTGQGARDPETMYAMLLPGPRG